MANNHKRNNNKKNNKKNNNSKTDKSDTIKKRIAAQQKQFLEIYYKAKATNIAATCRAVGINRSTYYEWRSKYPEFNEACHEAEEALIDFAESKLIENLQAGREASLFFFLCNRAPERWKNIQHVKASGRFETVAKVELVPLTKKGNKHGASNRHNNKD